MLFSAIFIYAYSKFNNFMFKNPLIVLIFFDNLYENSWFINRCIHRFIKEIITIKPKKTKLIFVIATGRLFKDLNFVIYCKQEIYHAW